MYESWKYVLILLTETRVLKFISTYIIYFNQVMYICLFPLVGSQDFSGMSMEEVVPAVQETSIKRLVVGPLDVRLHSSAIHRILKMVTCAMDHEYEPYCKAQRGQRSKLYKYIIKKYTFSGLVFYSHLLSYFSVTRNCNSFHFIIFSSHCYFLAQPILQHTAVHESSDLLNHIREVKPNTFC